MLITRSADHHTPTVRRLRGFAFDPSLSSKLDTAEINQHIYTVPWEDVKEGPIGEYVEVIDFDPPSKCWYEPVDLDQTHLLAQDGLPPSLSNPQFHQQMVYAVVMTTITNFERALGRPVMWSDRTPADFGKTWDDFKSDAQKKKLFVQRLRIYPHALREANAYYSPQKKSLLFGYFPAGEVADPSVYPGGVVFSCLSHDIIAHETAHAILDGIHPRFMEVTQPDGLAFHEAFADIVALFQHFTFPQVVRHQLRHYRGDLELGNLLGELAQEFGQALGYRSSLRNALGDYDETGGWRRRDPDPELYATEFEPHARGSILVSAVFDAFIQIYNSRIKDLKRIATGGTGILPEGDLHPDLIGRFAAEATKAAQHVLTMCIRAIDYCPPVDIDFGDFLRALITADIDVVADDTYHYRLAFVEAFRRHGIYPRKLRALSEESLCWDSAAGFMQDFSKIEKIGGLLRQAFSRAPWHTSREARWMDFQEFRKDLHGDLLDVFSGDIDNKNLQRLTGLDFSLQKGRGQNRRVAFQVHALWPVQRQRMDGSVLNQIVFSLLQHRTLEPGAEGGRELWGGATFIVDLGQNKVSYIIRKPLFDQEHSTGRVTVARELLRSPAAPSLALTYGVLADDEPFAMLHSDVY